VTHLNIRVTGKVQGVYFRASTKIQADELGVLGYVCNKPDGSVWIEAEGTDAQLASFITWCRRGPARAQVDQVVSENGAWRGFTSFEVRK